MKKIFLFSLLFSFGLFSVAQGIYFQAQVKKSGSNLAFYIKATSPNPNITIKFDNLDFFIRWPDSETSPITGTPVINNVDFPGLTIQVDPFGPNGYGVDPGFISREYTTPGAGTTNASIAYVTGQEYLVFSVPVSNAISPNIEMCGNNQEGTPYFWACSKVPAAGQLDFTPHNSTNGNPNNQLFYGLPAQLSERTRGGAVLGKDFFQKIGSILPVKFTSFEVTKKANDAVIDWSVANEDANTNHYEIERSIDGNKFETIQTLSPLNNGSANNVYSKLDAGLTSIKNVGLIVYYRIKQVDNDGKISTTEVKAVRLSTKGNEITAYPNPIKDLTTIQLDIAKAEDVTMNLYDSDGKSIQNYTIQAAKGINTKKIDMNNLAAGNYMLKVTTSTEVKTIKLIKL